MLAPTAALAGSDVGSFEIDGNLADDSGPGEPIDWDTPPPMLTTFPDTTGSGDDSFNTGSKELQPGGWDCRVASAPGKDDIFPQGQIAFRTLDGDQFVYVNYTRAGVKGDAHIDYEFNQSTEPNPACPDLPQRTDGDIVITFDTEQGGKKIFVRAFRWAFKAGSTTEGTFTELPTGDKGVTFDGAVNIPNTIPGHVAGDFGEAALNLTDTIGNIACGQFATTYMKTRASTSIGSALKDRTAKQPVNVGECPSSNLAKAVRNVTAGGDFATSITASPGDVLEYRLTYTNSGTVAATDVVVTDTIQARQTYVPSSCNLDCSVSGPTLTWSLGTVEAGGNRVMTFRVTLDASFPAGTTAVRNVGVVDTAEEEPKPSNETTTTVPAAPVSNLAKAVRNVTAGGGFATSITASPGDVLEYRLTYANSGNAAASGVVVTDTIQARQTYVPSSCNLDCSVSGTTLTWSLGTVEAGGTRVMTFQVTLDASFPAGTTTVRNVGVVDTAEEEPKPSNETEVNVSAAPALTLAKEADKTTVGHDGLVTYTLSYANTGEAPATGVVITDTVPSGTAFESCTGGCSVSGSTVTWSIGTVAAGGSGSVTLTVRVTTFEACQVCNVATIASPDHDGGAPVSSDEVCVNVVPEANPAGANASGSATGALVHVPLPLGLPAIDATLPAGTGPGHDHTSVDSAQSGVGADSENAQVLDVDVPEPPPGSVLQADVLRAQTAATVTTAPAEANDTSVATATGVNVLNGVVTASLVRGVASATATGTSATVSSEGSVIEDLMIDPDGAGPLPPVAQAVAPNTRVELPLLGDGSYVVVYERAHSTSVPTGTQGGTYEADLTVNMIRVHATAVPLLGVVDVIVSQAVAHADFPQTTVCDGANAQEVSGHAFILDAQTDPSLLPTRVGYVDIPASGGSASQTLNSATVATNTTKTATSASTGTLDADSSDASSYAEAKFVCVLETDGACTVSARAVRSQANSTASATGRSSDAAGTEFVGLKVLGLAIAAPVAPNTVIDLPGIGFVILNEQFCDNGGTLAADCSDGTRPGHTGLTVRSIHLVVLDPASGSIPGAEVIVAEAHSDAAFAA